MKAEILRLKKVNDNLKDTYQKQQNAEIEQLKIKLNTLSMFEDKENIKNLRNELDNFRTQFGGSTAQPNDSFNEQNPLYTINQVINYFSKRNIMEASKGGLITAKKTTTAQPKTSSQKQIKIVNESNDMSGENGSRKKFCLIFLDTLTRLIRERDQYLSLGIYDENDPLILEINNQINELRA